MTGTSYSGKSSRTDTFLVGIAAFGEEAALYRRGQIAERAGERRTLAALLLPLLVEEEL